MHRTLSVEGQGTEPTGNYPKHPKITPHPDNLQVCEGAHLFFFFFSFLFSFSRSFLAISIMSEASFSGPRGAEGNGVLPPYREERVAARDRFLRKLSLTASLSNSLALETIKISTDQQTDMSTVSGGYTQMPNRGKKKNTH